MSAAPEKKETSEAKLSWAGRVPTIEPGKYADGMPLHDLHYLAFKLILRPNRFVSRKSLFDFGKVLKAPAEEHGVKFSTKGYRDEPLKIREVLFVDTHDFRLYNNAFILRRRIPYTDGFPSGEPEVVFKYRHPDIQKAAEMDVRPQIVGDHRVKFKCQVLPLRDELGGMRVLYSHNVQFPRAHVGENDMFPVGTLTKIFPPLEPVLTKADERIELVSDTFVEEVLQDIGELDFGHGLTAKANTGIWRTRGEHRPLIGEFAYQIRFEDRKELKLEAMKKAEAFFISLQYAAKDWLALNATKTGVVYRLKGNPPNSHE